MKRDHQLVVEFLAAYSRKTGIEHKVERWPEEEDRNKKAVEALARSERGDAVAVEHTLLELFVGKRGDDVPFMKVFGALESYPELRRSRHRVSVSVGIGVIPKGVSWDEVAAHTREYMAKRIHDLPVGVTRESISGLTFDMPITIEIDTDDAEVKGRFSVERSDPPNTLKDVMHAALTKKLPKLIEAQAHRRILLLEREEHHGGYFERRRAIDELASQSRQLSEQLAKINEIWIVKTAAWKSEGVLFFYELLPNFGESRVWQASKPIAAEY